MVLHRCCLWLAFASPAAGGGWFSVTLLIGSLVIGSSLLSRLFILPLSIVGLEAVAVAAATDAAASVNRMFDC
jgi:hypothetical protein